MVPGSVQLLKLPDKLGLSSRYKYSNNLVELDVQSAQHHGPACQYNHAAASKKKSHQYSERRCCANSNASRIAHHKQTMLHEYGCCLQHCGIPPAGSTPVSWLFCRSSVFSLMPCQWGSVPLSPQLLHLKLVRLDRQRGELQSAHSGGSVPCGCITNSTFGYQHSW